MQDFVSHELGAERAARIGLDPAIALDVMSLTFGATEFVPLALIRNIDPDILLESLRRLLALPDPQALSGALDICADRAADDGRFIELGDAILGKLVSDPTRLRGELATFATAFIFASAHIAKHQQLRKQPVFWRRLAASAHASLVTRILGSQEDEDHPLLTWAMRLVGKTFYISVLNDADVEPRWKPDWISPNFLAADICGRLHQVIQRLGEATPASWRTKIENAKDALVKDAHPFAHAYPSPLQGRRVPLAEMPPSDAPAAKSFVEFAAQPTVENFLMFMQFAYAFGYPPAARDPVLKAIRTLRSEMASTPPELAEAALQLGAYIAAGNRDAELADAIGTVAIERLVATPDFNRLLVPAIVLVECAAATESRSDALVTLARRMENIVFVAPPAALPEGLDILRILQSVDDELSPLLARAIATAKVGLRRVAAAQLPPQNRLTTIATASRIGYGDSAGLPPLNETR